MTSFDRGADEVLRIGVTFHPANGGPGPSKVDARPRVDNVRDLLPSRATMDAALDALRQLGFKTTSRGAATASIRGTRAQYERLTQSPLKEKVVAATGAQSFSVDSEPHHLDEKIAGLIDDVRVQPPHIYVPRTHTHRKPPLRASTPTARALAMAGPALPGLPDATPPEVKGFRLKVPADVAELINATAVHATGTRGTGVRIAVVDSGFFHMHPFFPANGFSSTVVLAPHATGATLDEVGHGTAVSSNVFAVAPAVSFIGVKLDDHLGSGPALSDAGASLLEGFHTAMALVPRPQIISLSVGYNLLDPITRGAMTTLPSSFKPLELEILAAIADGVVVVAAAGNGHFLFPGQMPDVITVGGVFVNRSGERIASDFASAFTSAIYPARTVPDLSGLVGMRNSSGAYIIMPVSPDGQLDRDNSLRDGTSADDGWSVFSGTSSATPQVAGVCALMLEQNPALSPAEVKTILQKTAVPVTDGHANPATDPAGGGVPASAHPGGATGAGLVDACRALSEVRRQMGLAPLAGCG